MTDRAGIIVIGTASLDILHGAGRTVHTIGGAGLYTALAAGCCGTEVGLIAPKPEPLPESLHPLAERVRWTGPVILPEQLPRLEIEHHGSGKATLLDASWGAESLLVPAILPAAIGNAGFVHIGALSSARRQLDFLEAVLAIRADNPYPLISAGTYARLAYGATGQVRELFERTDLFFMNDNEATALFGSPQQARTRAGALLFVTLGENGALLIEGDQVTAIAPYPITEQDPTGAGDTFCGAVLAHLARGETALNAARAAAKLAAGTVAGIGPAALLSTI